MALHIPDHTDYYSTPWYADGDRNYIKLVSANGDKESVHYLRDSIKSNDDLLHFTLEGVLGGSIKFMMYFSDDRHNIADPMITSEAKLLIQGPITVPQFDAVVSKINYVISDIQTSDDLFVAYMQAARKLGMTIHKLRE